MDKPPEDREARPGEAGMRATKYDAWAYLFIGLLGLVLLAFGAGALILPPGISFALIRRGLTENRPSWTLLGALIGLLWLLFLALTARRLFGAQKKKAG